MAKNNTSKKQKKPAKPTEDLIEVKKVGKGSAIAAGRNAKAVVINFFGGNWQLAVLIAVIVLVVSGYFVWKIVFPEKMTGDFRVAVAGFAAYGQSKDPNIGTELAQGVYQKLNEDLFQLSPGFTVTIWPPDKVGNVKGNNAEERALSAESIAEKIGADVIVYGFIDTSQPIWQVTPEFYVNSNNFYEAEEITGQHQLGAPFSLIGQSTLIGRVDLSNQFDARAQAISRITVGLAYYSLRDYQKALEIFQSAESILGWDENQGKAVLYLLEGNAALADNSLDAALLYLNKSLAIDPEYARPLISLGGVYYLQALQPFDKSQKPADIDLTLINKAIAEYNQAVLAKDQPALSDINAKVSFGLGQCYLMQVYSGNKTSLNPAIDKFKFVINDYDNGANPRIREITAESHARLGLVYALSGYPANAVQEYQLAANLLYDNPDRQKLYHDRAQSLQASITPTP